MISTQLEKNFYSLLESIKSSLNEKDHFEFAINNALKAKAMNFTFYKEVFEEKKQLIIGDLAKWKVLNLTNKKNNTYNDNDHISEVNQKNKLRKTCIKILNFIGGIFFGTGCASMFGSHVLLAFKVITVGVAMGPLFGGLAILAVGGIILGFSNKIANNKLSREFRLHNSKNFKDFLVNVAKIQIKEENEHLSKYDLLDPNLHKIYQRYKAAVILLPTE